MNTWADLLARSWTVIYTKGVLAEVAERRRGEIRSDLFEHSLDAGVGPAQQLQVVGRVLRGVPADVAWRRVARASHRRGRGGAPRALRGLTTLVVALVAAFNVLAGVSAATADGAGWSYSAPLLIAAAMVVLGLSLHEPSPRRATLFVVGGTVVPVVIFYWMAPIFIPALVLVSALVLTTARRRDPQPATVIATTAPGLLPARSERQRTAMTLAAGLLGGLCLGIVARAWMRLIAEDPAFTWSGTLFIVVGFTVFGLMQRLVAVARRRAMPRWKLTSIRVLGAIAMVPLFGAAGALMFPTVIGGGLALVRVDWRTVTRVLCAVVASGPVLFVGSQLVQTFGWSLHSAAGFVALITVYSALIYATQPTFAPVADGWHLPRWARIAIPVLVCLLFVVPLIGGGIK